MSEERLVISAINSAAKILFLFLLPSLGVFYTSFIVDYQQLNSFVPFFLSIQVLVYLLGRGRFFDVFDPFHGVAVLHFLYSSAALMFVADTGRIPQGDPIVLEHALEFCRISLILQSVISLANYILSHKKLPYISPVGNCNCFFGVKSVQLASITLMALVAFQVGELNPFGITSYGDRVLEYNINKRIDVTSGFSDFVNIFLQMCLLFIAIFVLAYNKRSVFFRSFSLLVIFFLVLKYLLAGDRSNLVTCVLSLAVVWHYTVSSFRPGYVVSFAVVGYVIFNLISIARVSSDPLEMIFVVTDFIVDNGVTVFALDRSGELMAGANFIKLISEVEASGVRWGGNTLDSILSFIPRFLMNREGYFGNETFVRWYYPEVFNEGGGHGYFLPMDGYWDFGLLGAVIFMVLYFIFLKYVYFSLMKNKHNIFYVFFYSIFYAQAIAFGMRSGIYAAIKQFFIYSIAIVFVLFVTRIRNQRPRAHFGV